VTNATNLSVPRILLNHLKSKKHKKKKVKKNLMNFLQKENELKEKCLFCRESFEKVKEIMNHMQLEHSFFIPDEKFCFDKKGLMKYLKEKVFEEGVCI